MIIIVNSTSGSGSTAWGCFIFSFKIVSSFRERTRCCTLVVSSFKAPFALPFSHLSSKFLRNLINGFGFSLNSEISEVSLGSFQIAKNGRPELFYKKGPATLLKKSLWHRYFPVNFAIFLGILFLQNTSGDCLLNAFKLSFDFFSFEVFWRRRLHDCFHCFSFRR